MARIEHRRVASRYPRAAAAPVVDDLDDASDDASDDEPKAPDAAFDRLSWLGWLSAGVAVGWLILQLRPLLDGGAFANARRLDDVVRVVRAFAGAAALALPAALELGVRDAWRRAPWLYRAAWLVAISEVASIVLQQASERFLADVDLTDPTQPVALAYAIASLAPAFATIGGLWALSDGLWDLGARPSRLILRLVGGAAVLVTFLTYVPYLGQLFSTDQVIVSVLNVVRLAVSFGVIGITAMAGAHLLAGAIGNLTPRAPWVFAGLAGACYVLGTYGRAATGIPIPQDLLLSLFYAVFALESAAPVLLLLAFATGLARAASLPTPVRRLVARWVRYPAA